MSAGAEAIVLAPGEGRKFPVGADDVFLKGSTEQQQAGFSVVGYRGAVQPGPPMHVHRTFEECWVVLGGEVEFRLPGRTTVGRAGPFLLVPRGVPHTFRFCRRPGGWGSSPRRATSG